MTRVGGVFITGHDPDYHAAGDGNRPGAQHLIQRAIAYVTFENPNPRLLLVSDGRNPGGDQIDSRRGMEAARFAFDVADYGSGTPGMLDLNAVDFNDYDCVVVASDYGGWLRQDELDILNARAPELHAFVNRGGGIVAFNESGNRVANGTPVLYEGTTANRFGFLPVAVTVVSRHQPAVGFTLTPTGASMGLHESDVNGNVSHSVFESTGGMHPVDHDAAGRIMSLVTRGVPMGPSGIAETMWIAHLDLLPGDSSVTTSFDANSSGVGSGQAGLVIASDTFGDVGNSGAEKVVWTALEVPPHFVVAGVRLCYELSHSGSYISRVVISQVQDPPSNEVIVLDDTTPLTHRGPICVDSAYASIDPAAGPLLLKLSVNFGDTSDRIVISGVGLYLLPKTA